MTYQYVGAIVVLEELAEDGTRCVRAHGVPYAAGKPLTLNRRHLDSRNPALYLVNLTAHQVELRVDDIDNPTQKPYGGVFQGFSGKTHVLLRPAGEAGSTLTITLLTGIEGGVTSGNVKKWETSITPISVSGGAKFCNTIEITYPPDVVVEC